MFKVSITSQGQISIPVSIRRTLGLNKKTKATVSVVNGKVVIESEKDFLDLAGTFKTRKKAPLKNIRKAFENYLAKSANK